MRYFLGIDGGGSKTVATVVNENGKEVGIGTSGSIDILNEPLEKFKENLFEAVRIALESKKLSLRNIAASCFGVPIVGDVEGIEGKIKPVIEELGLKHYTLVNDVRVALEGALPESSGAVLLAGTGAMVMAKDKYGNIFRVDGWGEHVGDLGSGYYIGQMTLRRVFEEYDGRLEHTPLSDMIKDFAKVSDLREILVKCKGANVRTYIASFSRIACQAAQIGVQEACEILDMAVNELLKSVRAIIKMIKSNEPIFLSTVGGLFNCDYIREKFRSSINDISSIELVEGRFAPHIGAVIMAAKRILNDHEMKIFYDGLDSGGQTQ